jgi:hypothetical protein
VHTDCLKLEESDCIGRQKHPGDDLHRVGQWAEASPWEGNANAQPCSWAQNTHLPLTGREQCGTVASSPQCEVAALIVCSMDGYTASRRREGRILEWNGWETFPGEMFSLCVLCFRKDLPRRGTVIRKDSLEKCGTGMLSWRKGTHGAIRLSLHHHPHHHLPIAAAIRSTRQCVTIAFNSASSVLFPDGEIEAQGMVTWLGSHETRL